MRLPKHHRYYQPLFWIIVPTTIQKNNIDTPIDNLPTSFVLRSPLSLPDRNKIDEINYQKQILSSGCTPIPLDGSKHYPCQELAHPNI